uniref:Uncharacterized protein n=1 Tax=Anopheles minimus TaxID=112268 RepID=A0A182WQ32_9DIPT
MKNVYEACINDLFPQFWYSLSRM